MPERSRDVWGQLDAPPLPIRLFAEMQEMIIASLLAVQKVMIQDKHAFEMYGYDIMVGGTAQPWRLPRSHANGRHASHRWTTSSSLGSSK